MTRWIVKGYDHLLRLYPHTFRSGFGEEMRGVFEEKLSNAQQEGYHYVMIVIAKELFDLPGNLFAEYASTAKGGSKYMNEKNSRLWLVCLPILLVVLLSIINPGFFLRLFNNFTGWAITINIILTVALNYLLLIRLRSRTKWQSVLVFLVTLYAIALLFLGPAYIMVAQSERIAGTINTFSTAILVMVSLALLGTILSISQRKINLDS